MTQQKAHPPLWIRSLVLLRPAGGPAIELLARLTTACAAFSEATAFHFCGAPHRAKAFQGTAAEIERLIVQARRASGAGQDLPVFFWTDKENPRVSLSLGREFHAPRRQYDKVEFSFALDRPLVGEGGHFSFDELIRFFSICVDAWQAATGAVHDSQLVEIAANRITVEEMKRQLPPSEHKYIPRSEVVRSVPKDLAERLGRYRHPKGFDVTLIPEAVYWINYWNQRQVDHIGKERVLAAPWALQQPHPCGGYVLASQTEQFDALNPRHLEKLAAIVDAVDLFNAQGKRATSQKAAR